MTTAPALKNNCAIPAISAILEAETQRWFIIARTREFVNPRQLKPHIHTELLPHTPFRTSCIQLKVNLPWLSWVMQSPGEGGAEDGVWGLTNVWRSVGAVPLTAL